MSLLEYLDRTGSRVTDKVFNKYRELKMTQNEWSYLLFKKSF